MIKVSPQYPLGSEISEMTTINEENAFSLRGKILDHVFLLTLSPFFYIHIYTHINIYVYINHLVYSKIEEVNAVFPLECKF